MLTQEKIDKAVAALRAAEGTRRPSRYTPYRKDADGVIAVCACVIIDEALNGAVAMEDINWKPAFSESARMGGIWVSEGYLGDDSVYSRISKHGIKISRIFAAFDFHGSFSEVADLLIVETKQYLKNSAEIIRIPN